MNAGARRAAMWALIVVVPAPLVAVLNASMPDTFNVRWPASVGLIAYCWWLLALVLSTRPRWADRWVGLPQVYLLHGVLGVGAIAAAFLHRENSFAADDLVKRLGDVAFFGGLAVVCYSIVFLSGWLTDRIGAVAAFKRWFETRFLRHQVSVWIHRFNLVAIGLIFLHVHLIGRINRHLGFMIFFDVVTVAALGLWAWWKWGAPDGYLTGRVRDNHALNDSAISLSVDLDAPAPQVRPGDYYFVRFEAAGLPREWHPFSATDASQEAIRFTIRRRGDGTRTMDRVPAETRVRLEGPFGLFDEIVAASPNEAPLVLVGLGAGVAPLLSLIDAHAASRPIHLMRSLHRPADDFYAEAIDGYIRDSGGRLRVTTQVGRFRRGQFRELLTPDEIEQGSFFVVGPSPAVLASRRALRAAGVAAARLHDERMTL